MPRLAIATRTAGVKTRVERNAAKHKNIGRRKPPAIPTRQPGRSSSERTAYLLALLKAYRTMERKGGAILSIDFEGYRQGICTETGYVLREWSGTEVDDDLDLIANSSRHYRSEHARRQSTLNKGETQQLKLREIVAALRDRVSRLAKRHIPTFILLHDHRGDSQCLASVFHFPLTWLNLYHPTKTNIICLVDTQQLFACVHSLGQTQISLGDCCANLGIATSNLHNAANDAAYTSDLFFALVARAETKLGRTLGSSPEKRVQPAPPKRMVVIDLDPIDVDAEASPASFPKRRTKGPPIVLDIDGDDEVELVRPAKRKKVVLDID